MAPDKNVDEAEWEEEESLVVVELMGVIDHNMIASADRTNCNILGVDSDRPLLQLDRCVFVGDYQEAVGTMLLFEENSSAASRGDNSHKDLKYVGKTLKQLVMKRAFVAEKAETADTQASNLEVSETREDAELGGDILWEADSLCHPSEDLTEDDTEDQMPVDYQT